MRAKELHDSIWVLGPEFLWSQDYTWLNSNEKNYNLSDDDPDIKKSVTMTSSSEESKSTLIERVKRFSGWYRAQQAVALCMKYMNKLKACAKKEPHETVQVRAQDLERAGKLIIHVMQFKAFIDQLKEPTKGEEDSSMHRTTKLHNPIRKLHPYIDEDGILHVGGHLRNADLSHQVKHPIILLRGSHVTKLIIEHYHECTKHQGKGMMLNEIRSRGYWLIRGTSTVSTVITSRVTCRKL